MKNTTLPATLATMCVLVSACAAPPDPRQAIADAITDSLLCNDVARPSTLARIRAAIEAPSLQTIQAAVLAPEDLASAVAMAGPQVEGTIIVARNLWFVVDAGIGQNVIQHGWDGLQCGDTVPLQCTAGSASSTVDCTEHDGLGGDITVRQQFARCVLNGVLLDGQVGLARSADDDHIMVDVDGLEMDEVTRLRGTLDVDIRPQAKGGFSAAVTSPMAFIDHGGIAGGASCGEELDVDAFVVDVADGHARVDLDGAWRTTERDVGVLTGDAGVQFDGRCGCPVPGSAVSFEVPRPLGHDDETAIAHVQWRAPGAGSDGCATVDVDLEHWPRRCAGLEGVGSDCGEEAVRATMQAVLQAFCVVD